MGRCQILLENEISIFKKLVSRRKHEVLQNVLVNGCSDVGFQKTQWTNTSRWHCTQIITDCGNFTLDFKQLGLWASPPFLQTLGPWKEDFGPLGNSPVLLLLSPGKMPLMTTVIFDQYLYFHLSNGVVYFIRLWFPVSTFCDLTHIYCT